MGKRVCGVQSPFQGDGEGLEALDGDAARRAKVLREAWKTMNKAYSNE